MSAAAQPIPGAVSGGGTREAGAVASIAPAIVTLTLPAPPSANALFSNKPGQGRHRTKLYDDWLGHAGWRLRLQKPASLTGPVLVLVGVERTSAFADIDNRLKPTLDLLVKHRVIEDDRFVIGIAAAWSPARDSLMRLAIVPAANLGVRFHLADDGAHGGWFLQAPLPEEGAI